jgi:hypothetical protein
MQVQIPNAATIEKFIKIHPDLVKRAGLLEHEDLFETA